MKIFIAGCGRSGTTLIRDLMKCFEDTTVFVDGPYGEAPFSAFESLPTDKPHQVIKRTGECWRTLPLLPHEVELLYCVRHPFDTLTSIHPLTRHLRKFHITFERWSAEYRAWQQLREKQPERHIFILPYEELVCAPEATQARLAAYFGLQAAVSFLENPDHLVISARSVEKWKNNPEYQAYLQEIPRRMRAELLYFCDEFGYSLPGNYLAEGFGPKQIIRLQLIRVSNPNGMETLDGKPFFWMGGGPTLLDVESPADGEITLRFESHPGPSHPESSWRHLRIAIPGWEAIVAVEAGEVRIKTPVKRGENEIALEILEKPTAFSLPNGDIRPLMLGVLGLSIA